MKTIRKKVHITGVVQGIGFRPFVYRMAMARGVRGFVFNCAQGVFIEAESDEAAVAGFISDLKTKAPPGAVIRSLRAELIPLAGEREFKITASRTGGENSAAIPADMAMCDACRRDIKDPANRRYRYPFTNCTNCGPRFTIVRRLPYDRPHTVMDKFALCPACAAEYQNPADRRFHAQPNACPDCGPRAQYISGGNRVCAIAALRQAAQALADGKIIAVKSLGGFHLACQASNDAAVALLRARKNRPDKPFALMFPSLKAVKKHCRVSENEQAALLSSAAPAVTLKRITAAYPAAAPGLDTFAVMLPFTPLHELLFDCRAGLGLTGPLVMTSANRGGEPVLYEDETLCARLPGVFDALLTHNRDIHNPCDDSVVYETGGRIVPLRRARGYVPAGVKLPGAGSVMACGAQQKNTFCITRGDEAVLSQHIGDMDGLEAERFFLSSYEKLKALLSAEPELFARDLHPGYAAYALCRRLAAGREIIDVQHHHAHIASVMAEHGLKEPVIGAAFDGTGLGTDGAVWGGEFLVCRGGSFERAGALERTRLPGGDAAVRAPWRAALAWTGVEHGIFSAVPVEEFEAVSAMLESGFNSPLSSSMGRLFDAAAFLAGGPAEVSYEGQAAMEFEALASAGNGRCAVMPAFGIEETENFVTVSPGAALAEIAAIRQETRGALPVQLRREIACAFHHRVAQAATEAVELIARRTGIRTVALSGGVFQNRLLLGHTARLLKERGLHVYCNHAVPANDGGLSLGQAAVAAWKT
ncbi:MAG: carbamoyltransferase HypF [Elusimicrobiaceae bacterium]|nr:carbamoyltransferase HypF [Elusimicrobiaceae bacterium]